jgi:hypothetical protein
MFLLVYVLDYLSFTTKAVISLYCDLVSFEDGGLKQVDFMIPEVHTAVNMLVLVLWRSVSM